ncbi:hypothetical protein ACFYO2_42055 [Streptomyces sp. NPDC006602]|uniref:hypothetical protein n=1 Tax=Streptomyces sp. NPDC006602 TaxID=3364751 RepID=UPI0036897F99
MSGFSVKVPSGCGTRGEWTIRCVSSSASCMNACWNTSNGKVTPLLPEAAATAWNISPWCGGQASISDSPSPGTNALQNTRRRSPEASFGAAPVGT